MSQEFEVGSIKMLIPILKPKLPSAEEIFPYIRNIDASGIYSNRGPLVSRLEIRFAQFMNVDPSQIIVLANATLAIQGLVALSSVDSFLVPDFTFAATGHSVLNTKKKLILSDVSPRTWQLVPPHKPAGDKLGYVPVMPFGAPVDIKPWSKFENVIIDAAASLGAVGKDFSYLTSSSAVVFSLHATKVGGIGEGAVVVCGSSLLAEKLISWSNFGFSKSRTAEFLGTNAKMSEYQAAVAHAMLDKWDFEQEEWTKVLDYSTKRSREVGIDSLISHFEGTRPYWIAEFESKALRDRVSEALTLHNIESRLWWTKPLSQMPAFESCEVFLDGVNSRDLSERTLGLPMFRDLRKNQIDDIVNVISVEMEKFSDLRI